MPAAFNKEDMDMRVVYNKGGKRNGYHETVRDFDHPPDWDNEYSDEDAVFMQGGNLDRSSATKPLMFPRARTKARLNHSACARCRPIINAICCFLFLVLSLGSLMGLVVYFVNKHNKKLSSLEKNIQAASISAKILADQSKPDFSTIVGCDDVTVDDVWTVGIPKLLTESAFRPLDVNQDGVLDVILGFATGADGMSVPRIVCDIYFDGVYPCFGGLLALEGATGRELWRHYADHELYGINCEADLNKDGVNDCLAGGRAGAFRAVSGKDGTLLWNFGKQEAKNAIMNLYTAHIIADIDGDGVVDVLAIHGGDPLQDPGSPHRLSGRILLMSGATGHVIRWMGVPDGRESYYSPQIYTWPDGTDLVLFGTGGETHGGSLWVVTLADLIRGDIDMARPLFTDAHKGVMTPPVLVDLTGDGVEDIVLPVFNSSVLAIDGLNFSVIWNYTLPMSESYHTPSPGYYNDDDVPDFLIKSAKGPGFPVYFYSETTVLDGRTGQPLITPPIRDTVGAQASSLTVGVEGRGNDLFLYWAADCLDHPGEGGEFKFVEGTNVHEQSRSDFCKLRFKTKGYSKIYAIGRHIVAPGATVYYSEERKTLEHASWQNTTQMGIDFVASHPEYLEEYRKFAAFDADDTALTEDPEPGTELFPIEEGNESLFETPILDPSIRTTYKKGPKRPLDSFPFDERKKSGYPDYEYTAPILDEPYRSLERGPSLSGLNDDRYHKHQKQRIPNSDYGRSRVRPRNTKPDMTSISDIQQKQAIKPIAMRDTRVNTQTTNDNSIAYTIGRKRKLQSDKYNEKIGNSNFFQNRKRKRRHVGPHDEEGLQRLLSTGSLMPSLLPQNHKNYNHSIELVFATYWFFPAKTRAILPQDQKCIEKKMSEEEIRFDPKSSYYGMDHDAYEHTITDECLRSSGHDLPKEGTYESQTLYNPFNIHMGQMTVYRVRITCKCSNATDVVTSGKRCGHVLPFNQQQWRSYMGNHADSIWAPRTGN
ncbi:uncharacterized protein LOC127861055 [Dreissena polymorpha]|uniref:FAM234A/B beta-propeller domain-containing protein n=1 Tax=Dreissena polymorpha TaxID=45954 RepID=A0A9D3YK03_DREPO|nr:uncharacterized protein LOC127861055 [Dreissena polymorpha]KAH3701952.1 hypothetical protein DPMN_076950 [Dreissena polymorpha]